MTFRALNFGPPALRSELPETTLSSATTHVRGRHHGTNIGGQRGEYWSGKAKRVDGGANHTVNIISGIMVWHCLISAN